MRRLPKAVSATLALTPLVLFSGTVSHIPITGFEDGVAPRVGGEGRQPESRIDVVSSPVHSGGKSARLHYVFREGVTPRQYVEVPLTRRIPGRARSISAWLYGDGSRQQLKVRVTDAGNEIFQIAYGLVDWTGWREVVIDLTRRPEVSWGGNDDKAMDMPIKAVSYLVDSPVEPFESDLYLDDVTYAAEGEPLDFVSVEASSPVLGNAFYGQPPVITIRLTNVLAEPVENVVIDLRVTSPADGAVACELRKAVSLAAGASEMFELKTEIADYGLYHAQIDLDDARRERVAFSYLPEADTQDADPTSSFGVSMHFGHGGRGPLENSLRLASDMGIRWVRDDATWSSVEREKGVYVVPTIFDHFLRSSRSEWGCEPMIILDYSNTLYEKERSVVTEAGRQAFAKWAEFMARTYADSVTYWEIWNEPNIAGLWKPEPNPVDYALLLKAGYEGVKRGNPDAVVVAMVTAGIDLSFIENVLKEGTVGHFDAISVHPYRYPKPPDKAETTVEHLQRLVDLLAQHGASGTPIHNTEVGWPNQDDARGLPEQTSADWGAVSSVRAVSFDGPGKDQCSSPDDCSLAAKVAWDRTNLYVLVDVTDDTHPQTYARGDVWKGDGIQFAIDRHRASRPSDAPYIEIGLALTDGGAQVFCWTDTAGLVSEATCVIKRGGTHTVYEAAVPWEVLGGCPKPGDILGFALLANDNDGKEREGWVRLFDGIGWRKEPSKFGALMF